MLDFIWESYNRGISYIFLDRGLNFFEVRFSLSKLIIV